MSTATMAPEEATTHTREAPASAEKVKSWLERAWTKTKNVAGRFWGWVKNVAGRTWDWIQDAAGWTYDTVIGAGTWIKEKASWVWEKTKSGVDFIIHTPLEWTTKAYAWSKTVLVSAWAFTAPVRGWFTTPLRCAAGLSGGVVGFSVLGAKAIAVLAVIGIGYVLYSGYKRRRVMTDEEAVKLNDMYIDELIPEEERFPLTAEQEEAVIYRRKELDDRGDYSAASGNKSLISENSARMWFVDEVLNAREINAGRFFKEFRAYWQAELGVQQANDRFNWSAAKRAMVEEAKVTKKILDETRLVSESLV